MTLEDYDFPKEKICPNSKSFRSSCSPTKKHDFLDKFCSKCGSKLIEKELPLLLELITVNGDTIKINLDDFILLLKSKWQKEDI